MKRKTIVIYLIFILFPLFVNADDSLSTRTVTDMAERQITIPIKIERIICLGRGALRLVSYLNAADRIVGVEFPEKKRSSDTRPYLLAYPFLSEKPFIGYAAQGDPELILKVNPQVIIYADPALQTLETLQSKTGIPVLTIHPGDLQDHRQSLFQSLDLLGKVLDKTARCDSLKGGMLDLIRESKQIAALIPDTVSVYIGGLVFKGRHGLASTQAHYTPFQLFGLYNVANNLSGNPYSPTQINLEQLLLWRPDVIYVDKACIDHVKNDINQYPFLGDFQFYEIYPNRQYGENFETTLVNAFYIGFQLAGRSNEDFMFKAEQIYKLFFNSTRVWLDMQALFGLPAPFNN